MTEPEHLEAGGIPGKPQYMALLVSRDGSQVQRNYPTPPPSEVYEARGVWPSVEHVRDEPTRVERVAFRATGKKLKLKHGPQFKVYEEV